VKRRHGITSGSSPATKKPAFEPPGQGGAMGISIGETKAVSVVTITVSRSLNRADDHGPFRTRIKTSATDFAEKVIGKVISVRHNIEGARNHRSVWTIEAEKIGLSMLEGKERKGVIVQLQKSAATWAQKTFGPGVKVALEIK
jgi:hypothetical protein